MTNPFFFFSTLLFTGGGTGVCINFVKTNTKSSTIVRAASLRVSSSAIYRFRGSLILVRVYSIYRAGGVMRIIQTMIFFLFCFFVRNFRRAVKDDNFARR